MSNKVKRADDLDNQDSAASDNNLPYRQHFDDSFEEDPDAYQSEEEEERNERLVVRIVPKAIDYAIFLI